jgi:hypothetical protein
MDSSYSEKFRSPLVTFGLILVVVGLVISFSASISMDPVSSVEILLAALGRVMTGVAFQLLGLALIFIGRK